MFSIIFSEPKDNVPPTTRTEAKLLNSLSHLSQQELDFFNKWLEIIKLEADEDELNHTSKNLWLHSISKRYFN